MFTSTGIFQYDPGKGSKKFVPHWGLLTCDNDISAYYSWLLKRNGMELHPNDKGLWGTHVSVLKGEAPPKPEHWGKYEGYEVKFHYSHLIRFENGKHAWVDVYSEDLSAIRQELGFVFKPWYHLTIGRLVRPFDHLLDFSQDLT
jgi:hypothetical protein